MTYSKSEILECVTDHIISVMQRSQAKWTCKLLEGRGGLNTRQNSSICKKCSWKNYRRNIVLDLNQQWCLHEKWKPSYHKLPQTLRSLCWGLGGCILVVLTWKYKWSHPDSAAFRKWDRFSSPKKNNSNSWYLWLWILPPRLPGSTPCHRKVSHSRKVTEVSNKKDVKWQFQKWGRDREIFTGKFTSVVGNMLI